MAKLVSRDDVISSMQQVEALKKQLKEQQKHLRQLKVQFVERREDEFKRKHGTSSQDVRDAYVARLLKLCEPCSLGHYVRYKSIGGCIPMPSRPYPLHRLHPDDVLCTWWHHYLLPEHYQQAQLTSIEKEAFEVHDMMIDIEPTPHTTHFKG